MRTGRPTTIESKLRSEVIPDLSIDGNRKRWFRLEDFAETFALYLDMLDMADVLAPASHAEMTPPTTVCTAEYDDLVSRLFTVGSGGQ